MALIEYFKLVTALVVSIGGASVIIVALAKWFGDFLSHRLLDAYNNRHEKELEELKGKYANELEETKSELEKAKLQFVRYSEKQFELYNDLWKVLLYTKQQADMLWQRADPSQIPAFSEQINVMFKQRPISTKISTSIIMQPRAIIFSLFVNILNV